MCTLVARSSSPGSSIIRTSSLADARPRRRARHCASHRRSMTTVRFLQRVRTPARSSHRLVSIARRGSRTRAAGPSHPSTISMALVRRTGPRRWCTGRVAHGCGRAVDGLRLLRVFGAQSVCAHWNRRLVRQTGRARGSAPVAGRRQHNSRRDVGETMKHHQPELEAGTVNMADAVGLGRRSTISERVGLHNVASHERMAYATDKLRAIPGCDSSVPRARRRASSRSCWTAMFGRSGSGARPGGHRGARRPSLHSARSPHAQHGASVARPLQLPRRHRRACRCHHRTRSAALRWQLEAGVGTIRSSRPELCTPTS